MLYSNVSAQRHGESGWRAALGFKGADGKWRRKYVTLSTKGRGKAAKKQADNEAEALRAELNAKALSPSNEACAQQTVEEYMRDYIDSRASSIEPSTLGGYRRLLHDQIAPMLGNIKLNDLDPETVQAWVNKMRARWSAATTNKALVLLRSAMTQAVERDTLVKNPCRTVKNVKRTPKKPNSLDEKSRARLMAFFESAPASRNVLAYELAFYLGMRQGEVCGLIWRYVDLAAGTIQVQQAIGSDREPRAYKRGDSSYYVKEPKTEGSRRTLPIPDVLVPALAARRQECAERALRLGITDIEGFFVVGDDAGGFMCPSSLSHDWANISRVLGLSGTEGRRPTYHDLRHTFATTAIMNGVDVKTVSSLMGHSNAAMTLNVYASADANAKRRGIDTLAASLAAERRAQARKGQVIQFRPTGTEG